MLKIHSIETFGTHEGPGIRVVFFMQGCKLRCLYCHNPDTINTSFGTEITKEEILSAVKKSSAYFGDKGGVTFSGGECLLQAKDLIPVFRELKENGFHIAVDTNGFILDTYVEELLQYTDLVLLDIKHFYEENHKTLTGVSNKKILSFANYLEKLGKSFWVRHVLVPGYTDDEKHLNDLGAFLKEFKCLERLEILPYHTLGMYKWKEMGLRYGLEGVDPPTNKQLLKARSILENNLANVFIRR